MFTIDIDLKDEPTAISAASGGSVGSKAIRLIVDPTNIKDRGMLIACLERLSNKINEFPNWPPA